MASREHMRIPADRTEEQETAPQAITRPKPGGRKKSWSLAEDRALCEAWLRISDTQWESIYKTCIDEVKNAGPTGANENDEIIAARMLYEQNEGSGFNLMHCYELLKSSPKWCSTMQVFSKKRANKTRSARRDADVLLPDADGFIDLTPAEDAPRPIGYKKAKYQAASMEAHNAASRELLEIARRSEERSLKRLAILQTMLDIEREALDHEIMKLDLTPMDKIAREYFLKKKQKILSSVLESDN
ncbi:No apical meristem-associated C-terminal domain-containing protein [Dichotomocladium elegans]|nr:No apical meristem-associated C-terminal domain-containing protein [Dichotomocladium elegans]